MSNTVITNFRDASGPRSSADSPFVVVLERDGTISLDNAALDGLVSGDGSQSTGISVVRVGQDGRPDDATDSENEDDSVPHVTLSVDGYYDDPNGIAKYDSGIEMLQSLSNETREHSLIGFQNDHCYTPLTPPDEETPVSTSDNYDDLSKISLPSSKKITILEQQIIPKGKKILFNPTKAPAVLKGNEVLNKPVPSLGTKLSKKLANVPSPDSEMKDERADNSDKTESSASSTSEESVNDRDSDADYKYARDPINPKSKKTKTALKGVKKVIAKNYGTVKHMKPTAKSKATKSLIRQEIKDKILHNKKTKLQLEKKTSIPSIIRKHPQANIAANVVPTKEPAVEPKVETPKPQKVAKKDKKPPAHMTALLSDMTTLFSTPDMIRRVSVDGKPVKVEKGGVAGKESTPQEAMEIGESSDSKEKATKQATAVKTYGKSKVNLVKDLEAIPQLDDASLAQILQDSSPIASGAETTSSLGVATTTAPNPLSSPNLGPLSPTLDLLGGLQPEEEGLTEDLLMHVAQLVESSENLQEVIDKQVLGKVDPVVSKPHPPPIQTAQSYAAAAAAKNQRSSILRKDPIQIVRSDGRVITLPPIEAPATRSSKRKSLGTPAHEQQEPPIQESSIIPNPEPTLVQANPKQYANKKLNVKKIEIPQATTTPLKLLPESDDSLNSEDDPYRLWCICKQPHNNRFMICCDRCEEWFHGKCVNITKAMGQQMEEQGVEWTCPNCIDKFQHHKPTPKPGSVRRSMETGRQTPRTSTVSPGASVRNSDAGGAACIVCTKAARAGSIYCSDACILKHAQESLGTNTPPGAARTEAERSESRVIVFERKTGKVLQGPNAPTADNLKAWLQEHPTFEVVRRERENKPMVNIRKPLARPPHKIQTTLKFDKQQKQIILLQPQSKPTQPKSIPQSPQDELKTLQTPKRPPQLKQTLLIPKDGAVTPKHGSNNPKQGPPTPKQGPPTPKQGPPTPKQGPPTPKQGPPTPKQGPPMPRQGPPTPKQGPPTPKQGPPTPRQGPPTPKQGVPIPKLIPASPKTPEPKKTPQKITLVRTQSSAEKPQVKSPTTPTTRRREKEPEPKKKPISTAPVRESVRKGLQEHMTIRLNETEGVKFSDEEIKKFAIETELEMHDLFKEVSVKYKAKYRSLIFNIKDRKNLSLWQKICDRSLSPKQLVRMSAEELASQELAQWRDKEAKYQLELIKKSELDLLSASKTYVLKTHKGEEVMEQKSSAAELDPNVAVEDLVTALNDSGPPDQQPANEKDDKTKHLRPKEHKKIQYDDPPIRSSSRHKSQKDEKDKIGHKKSKDDKEHKAEDRRSRRDRHRSRSRSRGRTRERSKHRNKKDSRSKSASKDKDASSSSDTKARSRSRERSKNRSRSREIKQSASRSKRARSSRGQSHERPHRSLSQENDYHSKDKYSSKDDSMERPKSAMQKEIHPEYDPHEPMITSAISEEDLRRSREASFEEPYIGDSAEVDYKDEEYDPTSTLSFDELPPVASSTRTERIPSEAESDQEPSSTVDSAAPPVWNGLVNMVDVARFYVDAHQVSGSCAGLEEELSPELDIVGRINPETVWDYISKMKRTGSKDIIVLRLTSSAVATVEERMQYIALYSYLSTRNRLGVVKVTSSSVKDFYMFPLSANTPLPSVLHPLDGPGLDDTKTHLLIAIIVRQRKKRQSTSKPDAIPAKISKSSKRKRSYTPPVVAGESYTPPTSPAPKSNALRLPLPFVPPTPALSSSVKDKIAASLANAEEDEAYSPGGSSTDSGGGGGGGVGQDSLRSRVDEINRQIEEQKKQILSIANATVSQEDDEAYSPSRPMTPPRPALADIALPSNLQEILATIQQRSAAPAAPPPPPLDVDMRVPPPPPAGHLHALSEEELMRMVPDNAQ